MKFAQTLLCIHLTTVPSLNTLYVTSHTARKSLLQPRPLRSNMLPLCQCHVTQSPPLVRLIAAVLCRYANLNKIVQQLITSAARGPCLHSTLYWIINYSRSHRLYFRRSHFFVTTPMFNLFLLMLPHLSWAEYNKHVKEKL